ncbi:MAG: Rpn family recombination-promoting nuclease/putative transposase [Microcystis viridis Mv_BB_P_19951000_S69]|uniref:Rpn family recombination-promoting nuclease/putative transposase n=2 Tax=Microcystis TaxID=1125 RepID=A0A552H939_MICVR|nr:MAG: Rpn family recombination-promoting nuclease/putative transposase [Microcystis viridis Mv_BB_P_19951000_S68D]TRU69051.1 MAG: Rpn family recombination-promoting nuclease/putative transposase [Microcystis viridis Mv_BB_P_19951000_S68]TRU71549.1 MAG: Rpn family recombination-promoting nuclease/putative transposase [Microcystis viridis Mv_BB_P_19951000_S69]TRU80087.1 MAG: Rpn family recombination-promoting nuclease/putative transposase [Microcystis viridis Mv_BB_P_19951000_S69D]
MKTDTIFYQLFQSFPSIFFELIQLPINEANNYRFDSVEVKQLSFRLDGVFLPQNNNPQTPIYFCEVQFQEDKAFYQRFFTEIFLYLSKTDLTNDWRGVIVYPNPQVETNQVQRYRELLNCERVRRIYLNELENIPQTSIGLATVQLITLSKAKVLDSTRKLIQRVREELTPDQKPQELLQLIETILVYKLPLLNRREIETMFSLDELKQTQYFQDVREEARQEGRQEGREEGREEGRLNKALEAVPRLLALGLSVEQVASALELEVEQVRAISSPRI